MGFIGAEGKNLVMGKLVGVNHPAGDSQMPPHILGLNGSEEK
jgi:hypothetical protein